MDSTFFKITPSGLIFIQNNEDNLKHLSSIIKLSTNKIDELIAAHADLLKGTKIEKTFPESFKESGRQLYREDLKFLFQNCVALNNLNRKAIDGIKLSREEAFHYTNILLSVENSEHYIINKMKESFGSNFSFDFTTREINKIKPLYPSSCNSLLNKRICPDYCTNAVKKNNIDPILPNTNPVKIWLTPTKKTINISVDDLLERIADRDNIINAFWKLKKYHKVEDSLFFDNYDFNIFEKYLEIYALLISNIIKKEDNIPFVGYSQVDIPKSVDENYELTFRQMSYSSIFDQIIIQSIFNKVSLLLEQNFGMTIISIVLRVD